MSELSDMERDELSRLREFHAAALKWIRYRQSLRDADRAQAIAYEQMLFAESRCITHREPR